MTASNFSGPVVSAGGFQGNLIGNVTGTISGAGASNIIVNDATNNASTTVFTVTHTTSGAPAIGIGVGVEFAVETSASNIEVGGAVRAITTNVTAGTEAVDLVFYTMAAGATAAERFRLSSSLASLSTPLTATSVTASATGALSGAVTDGAVASITLDPNYSGAHTVTRHNYVVLEDVAVTGSTVTDACVFRFDAAIGTHKAVAAGTTKTSPGTVTAWMKVNVNGTIHYVPMYASTTT